MAFNLGDVPVLGDIYNAARGDPDKIKQAYDDQIAASQASQKQLQAFLMGQKGQTLAYYAPLQHMYSRAWGTEGIQGPQIPQTPGVTPYGGR